MRTFNSDADPFIMQQIRSDPRQPNHLERQDLWPNWLRAVTDMCCAEGGCRLGSIGDR